MERSRNHGTAVTRKSLSDHLAEQIVSGRLPAGSHLPSERQLAEQFGVSRAMVREALRSLVERHLVEVVPGRGAFVQHVRSSGVVQGFETLFRRRQVTPRDMVEARTALECAAAALAAERATAADFEALAGARVQLDRAGGILEQVRQDLAFHLAIVRAARNPVIETMYDAIVGLVVELMLRSLADPQVAGDALPYHLAIYEAIRDRDPGRAREAMAAHLAVAARLYGDDFDSSLETVTQRELARLLAPAMTLDALIEAAVPDLDGSVTRRLTAPSPDFGRGS
jgi:GntR family transcriptional repressor for pyruvate dehydrogenase complex